MLKRSNLVADLGVIQTVVFLGDEWKPVLEESFTLFLASWSIVLLHGERSLDLVELGHL